MRQWRNHQTSCHGLREEKYTNKHKYIKNIIGESLNSESQLTSRIESKHLFCKEECAFISLTWIGLIQLNIFTKFKKR